MAGGLGGTQQISDRITAQVIQALQKRVAALEGRMAELESRQPQGSFRGSAPVHRDNFDTKIVNLADPEDDQDAVTLKAMRDYVDQQIRVGLP